MADMSLEKAVAFSQILHAFQRVLRRTHVPGTDRYENDAEHSYSLAMMAWYLADSLQLPYDRKKIFEYALAHDLIEVYAGDTYSFTTDVAVMQSKDRREHDARMKIAREYREFPQLSDAIDRYEARADVEARFIYALDKVMPILVGFAQDGRDWKELSFQQVYDYKRDKIAGDPHVFALFDYLMKEIGKDRMKYFKE